MKRIGGSAGESTVTASISAFRRMLYRKIFCLEEWNIGTVSLPSGGLNAAIELQDLGTIHWRAHPGHTSYLADPFVWPDQKAVRVLVEEFNYWTGRGCIRSLALQGLLLGEVPKDEIKPPFHVSYPFVFLFEDCWYCVPECSESLAVDLYIWQSSSNRWQFKCRLLSNIAVYDPTLVHSEGLWYLFGTVKGDQPHSKLRIWWAHSLEGVWQSHPGNPVRIAPDQVRSAGAIVCADGRLYRPSQDCRNGYGSGIILNRIDILSRFDYQETALRAWYPQNDSAYGYGMHTISFTSTSAVVDGKRLRFTPLAAVWKSWWKLLTLLRWAVRLRLD
jgi:hypothetical protein